jgi:ferredoxin--NADP+ reductase
MEYVVANLDLEALDQEVARSAPVMQAIDQAPEEAKAFILSALPKALEPVSKTRFRFDFLASPVQIIGDAQGQVCGLEIEENKLIPANGDTKARGTGVKRVSAVDTVIFCIGDKVDESFGLPVQWNAFVKNPSPDYPVDGLSYEAYDPEAQKPLVGFFVAGWSREASSGLVGVARKDGERGARAVLQYLQTLPPLSDAQTILTNTEKILQRIHKPVIKKEDIQHLEAAEKTEADRLMVEEFKFGANEEMLAAMGLTLETA